VALIGRKHRLWRFVLLALVLTGALWPQQYVISTVAGGVPPPTPATGTNASMGPTSGVTVDATGNLFFTASQCVFKLDANGVMTRVAGNCRAGYSGDGGLATSAQLSLDFGFADGVAVDGQGNLYIADSVNRRIREVLPNGVIMTVAGDGTLAYSGDGGPASSAQVYPIDIAVEGQGNV
jgi:sugar lactone lactonase YvrE